MRAQLISILEKVLNFVKEYATEGEILNLPFCIYQLTRRFTQVLKF